MRALWALAKDYGREVVYSGPMSKSMKKEGGMITISFDHADGGLVAERDLVEALDLGAEALEVLLLAACSDGGQRPAVEGALEGDGAETFGVAVDVVIAPGGLDRALQRLGAGVREEHLVGKRSLDQALAEPSLAGDLIEVGNVP